MNQGKGYLGESTNSQVFEQSSNTISKNMASKAISIQLQQAETVSMVEKQQKGQNNEGHFSLGKVALVLEKRKEGIIQNNMVEKELGIQKWKLGKKIASGGTGQVYRALNSMTGCLCALKKVHIPQNDVQDCRNQIQILAKMNHPNIVKYVQHYYLMEQKETWIFMEYVPSSLQKFYKQFSPPPLQTFLFFLKQLLEALEYIHSNKIIHKDLKCANILLTNQGVLKLSDFGCSKSFEKTAVFMKYIADGSKTQKGTTPWMAPQSIRDTKYTPESDVWSFGCTMLELATGIIPWSQTKFDQFKLLIHIGQSQDIPLISPELPEITLKLIKGCLVRDPLKRSTVKDMLKMIEQYKKK